MKDNIIIRMATPDDAAALLTIYAPYVEHTAVSFEYAVPSIAEFAGRIERTLTRYPYLVAESAGNIIGYAYAGVFHAREAYDRSVETSIYVSRNARRNGIGERLYSCLERLLAAQGVLNLNACIAIADDSDPFLSHDSADFHAHMGYKTVGRFHQCGYKFGRWYDMIWMEKFIGEHTQHPAGFRSIGDIGCDVIKACGVVQ